MTNPAQANCPFCFPDPSRVFHRTDAILALWDGFPVTPGHALVVPHRHVATWFDATPEERLALMEGIDAARAHIEAKHGPDGYNIGVNIGAAGGQTVPHLHVHLIPRYTGDIPDPRGGVRYVIPWKANYVTGASPPAQLEAPHARPVLGSDRDPLLPHLVDDLTRARRVDMAVAFLMCSGLDLIEPHLRDLLARGGHLRLLTGDYLDVTEPEALLRLLDLPRDRVQFKVFQARKPIGFHPKAYLLHQTDESGVAYVGSSNVSRQALQQGVEWNYRIDGGRDPAAFRAVGEEFDGLFTHELTTELTTVWVEQYRARRKAPPEVVKEPEAALPAPNSVQQEALVALASTRAAGNEAGLVVLATGLGKTWLAAFDSEQFQRVLFVAHREEILDQAQRTFRRIRPNATLGKYTGRERAPTADAVFASIQTLGRKRHLEGFAPDHFDYIVVDEFHHADAATYRRLIDHFRPRFLLGLTATPERTDGGDLLALCGENLVYRCDLPEGIERSLLAPFHYFGVPDEVDYANIPWRSRRFDTDALSAALATQTRADNAFEQWRKRRGKRTLGFCVSQAHADFMAEHFRRAGIRAVAVHSGAASAPRQPSIDRLRKGELDVLFAVDIFNEGVDLPDVDTILMLRPTESKVIWLQQLGRGLRKVPDKVLTVVDYIGNHRIFRDKLSVLFQVGDQIGAQAQAFRAWQRGEAQLPPGCEVSYELQAQRILETLLRVPGNVGALKVWYEDFRARNDARPTAAEAFHAGHAPGGLRRSHGSWLEFVKSMGDLSPREEEALEAAEHWFRSLEKTPMTKSYKMVVLEAMLAADAFPGDIRLDALVDGFARIAHRSEHLRADVGDALDDRTSLRRLVEQNPVRFWAEGQGTGGVEYFRRARDEFGTTQRLPSTHRHEFQELTREIADWRLAAYLEARHAAAHGASQFTCKVSHNGRNPILFLPDRKKHPGIPEGWNTVLVEGQEYEVNFVKIAINLMRAPGSQANILPGLLKRWFGSNAGSGGSHRLVRLTARNGKYQLLPLT